MQLLKAEGLSELRQMLQTQNDQLDANSPTTAEELTVWLRLLDNRFAGEKKARRDFWGGNNIKRKRKERARALPPERSRLIKAFPPLLIFLPSLPLFPFLFLLLLLLLVLALLLFLFLFSLNIIRSTLFFWLSERKSTCWSLVSF